MIGATKQLFNDLEYRHALLVAKLPGNSHPLTGEYRGERHYGPATINSTGQRLRAASARAGASWPWWSVVGDDVETTLTDLEKSANWDQR